MKDRVYAGAATSHIAAALELLPGAIRDAVSHAKWVVGCDPIFIGLHSYTETADARSYRDTAHVCYPEHINACKADRATVVVLPQETEPWVVVHELGHVLDEVLGFAHTAQPVTAYAQTNRSEAFAEAFTAWLCPIEYRNVQHYLRADHATVGLFEELKA